MGKARTAITGSRGELWLLPPALISCCYKQSGGWQLRASAHHSQPGRQPRWMEDGEGKRRRSLTTVPPPRVPSQRPAGGTIPLPQHFQAVDLRLGWSPHLVPLAPRVQGLSPGPGGGGARAYNKVSSGLKAREEGLGAHPERRRSRARGWRGWAGGEAAAEPGSQLICSRISTGGGGAYLPHPLVSMVLGAGGRGHQARGRLGL